MKVDLHCHSSGSFDADAPIDAIIEQCHSAGIGVIAISDHDRISQFSPSSIALAQRYSVYIISAMELTTLEGVHIVALGVHAPLSCHESAETIINAIHAQGAIAVIVHPHRYGSGLMNNSLSGSVRSRIIECADAIEVLNGKSSNAERGLNEQFAQQYPMKGKTVGSDAHYPYEIGRVYLETQDDVRDIASLRRALMNPLNRFVALPRNERKERWYRHIENNVAWWAQWLHPFPSIHRRAKQFCWPILKSIRTFFY